MGLRVSELVLFLVHIVSLLFLLLSLDFVDLGAEGPEIGLDSLAYLLVRIPDHALIQDLLQLFEVNQLVDELVRILKDAGKEQVQTVLDELGNRVLVVFFSVTLALAVEHTS